MEYILEYAKENFPVLAVLLILLNIFKEPVGKILAGRFSFLASAWVKDREDKREFGQEQAALALASKLSDSEHERELQAKRELEYWNIINRMVSFSQEVLMEKVGESKSEILMELKSVKKILNRMAEQMRQRQFE